MRSARLWVDLQSADILGLGASPLTPSATLAPLTFDDVVHGLKAGMPAVHKEVASRASAVALAARLMGADAQLAADFGHSPEALANHLRGLADRHRGELINFRRETAAAHSPS